MTTATTNGSPGKATARRPPPGNITRVERLDDLVGGHPGALRAIFAAGATPDPADLPGSWSGRILALEPARNMSSLMRPVMQAIHGGGPLFRGKTFFSDGTGNNHLLSGDGARFAFEPGLSELDGGPAIILSYDPPRLENRWPVRNLRGEMRHVGGRIAMGPVLFSATRAGERRLLFWFGLERDL
ncbi:MAG: hypothetical protein R3F14_01765 [Polyangiaceae bacterium]